MKKNEYIILLVAIAILSAYLLLNKRGSVNYSMPVLSKVDRDSISKLVIKKGSAKVTLTKNDSKWTITEDGSNAEKAPVDQMLKAIDELNLTSLVSESENYAVYDLDEKNGIEVKVLDASDKVIRRMVIGKAATSFGQTLVTVGDDDKVYHAKGNIRNLFDKSVPTLRDKSVMTFSEDISEITLHDGTKDVVIMRAPAEPSQEGDDEKKETEVKWQTKDGEPVKKTDIDDIINTLKNLRCDKYVEGKRKTDLKDSTYSITLKGNKSYTITLFAKDGSLHQATSSESNFAFLLADHKANKIKKDLSAITETKE